MYMTCVQDPLFHFPFSAFGSFLLAKVLLVTHHIVKAIAEMPSLLSELAGPRGRLWSIAGGRAGVSHIPLEGAERLHASRMKLS